MQIGTPTFGQIVNKHLISLQTDLANYKNTVCYQNTVKVTELLRVAIANFAFL